MAGEAGAFVAVTAMPIAAMFAAMALKGIASPNASIKIEKSSADLKHEQDVARARRRAEFMTKRRDQLGEGENAAQTRAAEEAFQATEKAHYMEDAKALKAVRDAEAANKPKQGDPVVVAGPAAAALAKVLVPPAPAADVNGETPDPAAANEKKQSFLNSVIAALGSRDGSLSNLVKTARANPDLVNGVFIAKFAEAVQEAAENDRLSSTTQTLKELVPFSSARKERLLATEESQLQLAKQAAETSRVTRGGKRTRRRIRGGVVMTSDVSALIKLALYGDPNQYSVSEAFKTIVTHDTSEQDDKKRARITEFLRGPFTEFIDFRANFLKSTDVPKRNCAITMFDQALEGAKEGFRTELFVNRAAVINTWGIAALLKFPDLEQKLTERAKTLKWASNLQNWLDVVHSALDKGEKAASSISDTAVEMAKVANAKAAAAEAQNAATVHPSSTEASPANPEDIAEAKNIRDTWERYEKAIQNVRLNKGDSAANREYEEARSKVLRLPEYPKGPLAQAARVESVKTHYQAEREMGVPVAGPAPADPAAGIGGITADPPVIQQERSPAADIYANDLETARRVNEGVDHNEIGVDLVEESKFPAPEAPAELRSRVERLYADNPEGAAEVLRSANEMIAAAPRNNATHITPSNQGRPREAPTTVGPKQSVAEVLEAERKKAGWKRPTGGRRKRRRTPKRRLTPKKKLRKSTFRRHRKH